MYAQSRSLLRRLYTEAIFREYEDREWPGPRSMRLVCEPDMHLDELTGQDVVTAPCSSVFECADDPHERLAEPGARVCRLHLNGVGPEVRSHWYVPGCPVCERKRAAGVVTGSEPRVPAENARWADAW